MDELWTRSDHGTAPIAARDATMLRWRFDAAPSTKTRYLLLSGGNSGALLAWFACQAESGTLHVRDFWSIDAANGTSRSVFAALLRAARKARHSVVSIEYAGPPPRRAALLDAGFVERTRRPVYGKWTSSPPAGELHLTSADEDE